MEIVKTPWPAGNPNRDWALALEPKRSSAKKPFRVFLTPCADLSENNGNNLNIYLRTGEIRKTNVSGLRTLEKQGAKLEIVTISPTTLDYVKYILKSNLSNEAKEMALDIVAQRAKESYKNFPLNILVISSDPVRRLEILTSLQRSILRTRNEDDNSI